MLWPAAFLSSPAPMSFLFAAAVLPPFQWLTKLYKMEGKVKRVFDHNKTSALFKITANFSISSWLDRALCLMAFSFTLPAHQRFKGENVQKVFFKHLFSQAKWFKDKSLKPWAIIDPVRPFFILPLSLSVFSYLTLSVFFPVLFTDKYWVFHWGAAMHTQA